MNINKEKFFPLDPGTVWKALTDSAILSVWFMVTDFKPVLGFCFYFRAGDGTIITGEVLEIVLLKKLVYSWKREGLSKPTTVTWSLLEMQQGTLLRLEHDGFDDDSLVLFQAHNAGWDDKLAKLNKFLIH